MTNELSGFTYRETRFDKDARPVSADDRLAVAEMAGDQRVTDLVVLAHGWNHDMEEARGLYGRLAASLRGVHDGGDANLVQGRRLALLGVLWPSKRFDDRDLIPGGAAAYGIADGDGELEPRLEELRGFFDAPDADDRLAEAQRLVPELGDSTTARAAFVELIRRVLPRDAAESEDASDEFFSLPPQHVFEQLEDPSLGDPELWETVPNGPDEDSEGAAAVVEDLDADAAAGAAAGWGPVGALANPARSLLNYATYYQMKARAGAIGGDGVAPLLRQSAHVDLRLHLVGHSFGARLVTAAAANPAGLGGRLCSLTLLQGAFSHYGFSRDWEPGKDGLFRAVLTGGGLLGPMLITHTRNDRAVGIAYAIASRLANQVAAEIGDARSRFGGIGANGAQRTPEAVAQQLLAVDHPYTFTAGKLYNLRADGFIANHGAVSGREVAHALLAAIAATE